MRTCGHNRLGMSAVLLLLCFQSAADVWSVGSPLGDRDTGGDVRDAANLVSNTPGHKYAKPDVSTWQVAMETREVTRMANRIRAAHRWAVTGTPLGPHCLADLYGLLQARRCLKAWGTLQAPGLHCVPR